MRVFVYEFATGGGLAGETLYGNLVREGDLMLQALVSDLVACRGIDVLISRDARLPPLRQPVCTHWVDMNNPMPDVWASCLEAADAVWPIAPETSGVLERVCRSVSMAGRILLNTGEAAIAIAASKHATATQLRARGVPAIETWRMDQLPLLAGEAWVLKPDRGEGCNNTFLVRSLDNLPYGDPEWVLQPYVSGQAASLSLLADGRQVRVLSRNRQRVVLIDDRFKLLSCVVNGLEAHTGPIETLARSVMAALPGLRGYVGIDFILTEQGPRVLEINPRLTLSYVGLSRSLECNVAALVLNELTKQQPQHFAFERMDPVTVEVDVSHAV
ncbi:MAG: ATP-grasp domain-containing protein [Pirellulaceae bacterium]